MRVLVKVVVVITAVAGFFTLALGGSLWAWLVGVIFGKFIFRLVLTISLAIIIYVLTYALIIGGLFWILIS